jgi:hypothetical protein
MRWQTVLSKALPSIFSEVYGVKLETINASSKTTTFNDGRIEPNPSFKKAQEYYCSSPRIFNVVESNVLEVINREWYYDGDEKLVEILTNWEKKVNLKNLFKYMVRSWEIFGVHILSPTDWEGIQMTTILAKRRDEDGNTVEYIQSRDGQEHKINAADFIELPFIQVEREPWGFSQFHSLFFNAYVDIDGKDPRPIVELQRQTTQDTMKIHHKFASPRVFYNVPNVDKKVLDDDIVPVIEGMAPGDRAAFNTEIKPEMEVVDTSSRFNDSVMNIDKEMDIGTQSSRNRKIAEPSAMADAESASRDDDDHIMGIMEEIKHFMNKILIPHVLGIKDIEDPSMMPEIEFKWGARDRFDLEYPEGISKALNDGVITIQQASKMLQDQYRWKIPTETELAEDPDAIPMEKPVEPFSPEIVRYLEERQTNLKKDSTIKEKMFEMLKRLEE